MPLSEQIASRTVGAFPISIATSLAVESALGVHPEIMVEKPPIREYGELWINLRTLFRNFIGALDKDTASRVGPGEICEALLGEMDSIHSIVTGETNSTARVVYYLSDYADIENKYKLAVIRRDTTDKQKEYTAIQTQTFERLLKIVGQGSVRLFPLKIKTENKPAAMIITHIAYDLVAYKEFRKLVLLESHTGAIKERSQWYTKYYQGKTLSMIPFREDFIQIFGDNETFRTGDITVKKDIIDIATKYRWSAVTTYEKIRYGIEQLKNPYSKKIVLEIIKPNY